MPAKLVLIILLSAIGALHGCGDDSGSANVGGNNSAAAEQHSRSLSPEDSALKDIYDRSCRNCHTIAATGAPLTGDVPGWAPRMDKGMDTLLNNVIDGFGGMPPFGLCMDCDVEQFEALIEFMAAPGN